MGEWTELRDAQEIDRPGDADAEQLPRRTRSGENACRNAAAIRGSTAHDGAVIRLREDGRTRSGNEQCKDKKPQIRMGRLRREKQRSGEKAPSARRR